MHTVSRGYRRPEAGGISLPVLGCFKPKCKFYCIINKITKLLVSTNENCEKVIEQYHSTTMAWNGGCQPVIMPGWLIVMSAACELDRLMTAELSAGRFSTTIIIIIIFIIIVTLTTGHLTAELIQNVRRNVSLNCLQHTDTTHQQHRTLYTINF